MTASLVAIGAFFNSIPGRRPAACRDPDKDAASPERRRLPSGRALIFINFDPSIFIDRAIADTALRDMRLVLNEAGIDARRVVCEVTEQRSGSDETLFRFVAGAEGAMDFVSPSTTMAPMIST